MRHGFIPPYLLERLAQAPDPELARTGVRTQSLDRRVRGRREALPTVPAGPAAAWEIYSAGNTEQLPGELVRSAGEPPAGDPAVDEAAAGVQATLDLLADLGRSSYDGRGTGVVATVHFGRDYDNAFWDGRQLVFGDGDGKVFDRFTKPVDVLAHELAHALTQHTANLRYADQPGALNESVSDVVGACVKQRVLGQTAAEADWLVGEGIFLPGVQGRALRSMSAPGTAYDDPRLGRDPQVGHLDDYIETAEDNGGVHLNSGIPNRAFHLAATAIGGTTWEGAGRIWFAALTSGIGPGTDFAGFATACVAAAGEHADLVRGAWDAVGVVPGSTLPSSSGRGTREGEVRVVRSGGFAGIVREDAVDLAAPDPRARQVRELVDRIDFARLDEDEPQPDRFVYLFCTPRGDCRVGEASLTTDLRRLAGLVLGD